MISFIVYSYSNIGYPQFIMDKDIEDIESLQVSIVSGDEIIYMKFRDGTAYQFDSGIQDPRLSDYFDGGYVLTKQKDIRKWLEYDGKTEYNIDCPYDRWYRHMEGFGA